MIGPGLPGSECQVLGGQILHERRSGVHLQDQTIWKYALHHGQPDGRILANDPAIEGMPVHPLCGARQGAVPVGHNTHGTSGSSCELSEALKKLLKTSTTHRFTLTISSVTQPISWNTLIFWTRFWLD